MEKQEYLILIINILVHFLIKPINGLINHIKLR